ncbi:MAG: response regulator, partial [Deltaproteobacteria bacterium]|nr:response regulator [Deltaproteobacteria bacterium]
MTRPLRKPLHVLIVDHSEEEAKHMVRELRARGYEPSFQRVDSAESMAAALAQPGWQLVIADSNIPNFSGLNALALVRERGLDLPFLIVADEGTEETVVTALKAGAHDYIAKSNLARLASSVERELRDAEARRERKVGAEHLQQRRELQAALVDASVAITSTLDLKTLLSFLLEKVDLVLPNSATTVRLYEKDTGALEPIACRNIEEKEWREAHKTASRDSKRKLARPLPTNGYPIRLDKAYADPGSIDIFRRYGFVSYLEVPLLAKDEMLGVLGFYAHKGHQFSEEEVEFLSMLSTQAAIAIQKSQLYEQTRIERANRVKSEFLSLISHELRTPLTAIIGYTGVVRDGIFGPLNTEQEESLNRVLSRSSNLLEMIESILQATIFETEEIKMLQVNFSLSDFLSELRLLYRIPLEKDITLKWDYPSHLPTIKTDRTKLMHILRNLISNAIKFTEK